MKNLNSRTFDHTKVDMWQSRPREVVRESFIYTWFHTATGKRGIGIITVRSKAALISWMKTWNDLGVTRGWNYSIFDAGL